LSPPHTTPTHCPQPAHVKRTYHPLNSHEHVPQSFNLQRLVSCEHRRSSVLSWETRTKICLILETSPRRPILYTSQEKLSRHGKPAGMSAPFWKLRGNMSHPRNQAGISIPSWKPREYIFPIMETSQGQLSHTGNLAGIAVPSRKPREITVPLQKLRRTMSHLGKLARTFVPVWKHRTNIFPILETKQEYPSHPGNLASISFPSWKPRRGSCPILETSHG